MVKVVVLGAHGRVAQIVEKFLFADKDVQTSLFLRNASRMADKKNQATIFEGSATDAAQLEKAMKGQDIVYASNHVIKKLLVVQDPPPLPLVQLSVQEVRLPSSHWTFERLLQRDVLPVYADFLFRLQHNGLGFRYKYRWHTDDVHCVYGCTTPETPHHLFWECYMAKYLWRHFLSPIV